MIETKQHVRLISHEGHYFILLTDQTSPSFSSKNLGKIMTTYLYH